LPDGTYWLQEHVIGRYNYTVACGTGADAVQASVAVDWTGTPTVSVSAPDGAVRGSTFSVSYKTNVVPCTASGGDPGDNWSGQFQDAFGYVTVLAQTTGTRTYTITCGSGAQTVTASTSVNVVPSTPQVTLTADKTGQLTGVPVTLTWSSNVSPCVQSGGSPGDGWGGSFGSAGSAAVTETSASIYVFLVVCGTGSLTASASTFVQYADVAAPMLTASKSEALVGESITLTWASTDGSACLATGGTGVDGWYGNRAASGSMDVRESYAGMSSFVLACGRSLPATVQVQIDLPPTPLSPSVGLTASAGTVQVGDPFTLTWTASNAQSCGASGGAANDGWAGTLAATGGSVTIREPIDARYSYVVTCFGASGATVGAVANVLVYQPMTTTSPSPATSSSSGGGGGGGGAMGPVDVAFFSALALCGFVRRRRIAAQRSVVD
jgi:hypothetical protein